MISNRENPSDAPSNCARIKRASASDASRVSDWIGEITKAWSRSGTHTLELAKVVATARRRLHFGEWSSLWGNGQMPFSKRKGEMLVVIGERLGCLDAQTFAHLPAGWSILYQLAQLSRVVFEQMVREAIIHPKLTLQEARELLARFKGRRTRPAAQRTSVKHRLRQFRLYVQRTVGGWKLEERQRARTELTQLLELIDSAGGATFIEPRANHNSLTLPTTALVSPWEVNSIS